MKWIITLFITFNVILCSCQQTESKKQIATDSTTSIIKADSTNKDTTNTESVQNNVSPKQEIQSSVKVENNRIYNDYARFIAGLPLEEGNNLGKAAEYQTYKSFAASFDSSWKKVDQARYAKMRAWADTEFVEVRNSNKTVLYPFSGPDFVNVFTFFPNADTYVMMALEPVGEYVDFSNKSEKEVDQYLASVDNALNDLFKKSYFITMHMIGDLHKAKGVLPLTSLFMARTGNTILNVQRVKIDSSGSIILDSLFKKKASKPNAIKIEFVNDKNPDLVKTLYYIKGDMSDNGCKTVSKGVVKFLKNYNNCIGYFKSASYLCHMRDFGVIRNLMLDQCDYIVQDDTGIAYRFFKSTKWKLSLYGKYAKPVKDFSGVDQDDLRKAYKNPNIKVEPLPFSLGYHWGTQNQNLMKAVKIQ